MESMSSISDLLRSVYQNRQKISQSINSALSNTVSKISQYKTNIIYSIKHSDLTPLSRKQIQIKQGDQAQLFGLWYTHEQSYKLLFVFRQTYWFTYRGGNKDIESDNGWGCMIRTVQMVFAQVLKRHLKLTQQQKDRYQIIGYFSDQRQGAFSLNFICSAGGIAKRWVSSIQVLSVFKKIMKQYPQIFNFEVQIYTMGVVYQKIDDVLLKKYPAMAVLSTRVSLQSIPQQLYGHFFQLMNSQYWVGSIGGINQQALFIIGHYNNKVIFLDPHYVQSNYEDDQTQSYCCKSPRGIQVSQLNPSISYCYYFQTQQQNIKWIEWISSTCQKYQNYQVFEFISKSKKSKPFRKKSIELQIIKQPQTKYQTFQNNFHPHQLQIISDGHSDSSQFQILQ